MQTFKWRIDKFSDKTKHVDKLESPAFDLFGHSWCISFWPNGMTDTSVHPGVFLKWNYSDNDVAKPLLRFTFLFTNDDRSVAFHVCYRALHRFTQEDFDWGWCVFCQRELLQLISAGDHLAIQVFAADNVNDNIEEQCAGNICIRGLSLVHANRFVDSDHSILLKAGLDTTADIPAQALQQIITFICQNNIDVDADSLFDLIVEAHTIGLDVVAKSGVIVDMHTAVTLLNTTFHTGNYALKSKCLDFILPRTDGTFDQRTLRPHCKLASLIQIINETARRYRDKYNPSTWLIYHRHLLIFIVEWLQMKGNYAYMQILVSTSDIKAIIRVTDPAELLRSRYKDDPRYDALLDCNSRLRSLTLKLDAS